MLGEIRPLTLDAVRQLLAQPRRRNISSIHVHHTWRPTASQWRGRSTVEAMRRVHMQDNGWSDIAQHLTLGPDGSLWSGRHIDHAPASAKNFNGSGTDGPFMIEMVGDFDVGRDAFADPQAAAAYELVATLRHACGLGSEAVRFHNELSPKSCPGTSIDLAAFRAEVDKRVPKARGAVRQPVDTRLPARPDAARDADAEPTYDHDHGASMRGDGRDDIDAPAAPQTQAQRAFFERHVVNIAGGRLSDDGRACSTPQQLDTLVASLITWAGTDTTNRNVLLWAHGGLVSEGAAVDDIVLDDGPWWLDNGVYPIFFVWETGLFETFRQMLTRDRAVVARGLKDEFVEWFVRHTLGPRIWRQMKDSASLASEPRLGDGSEGGAYALARRLAPALDAFNAKSKAKPLRLHMAGHSAGAIFASHLVPTFASLPKATPFETLTHLAPALRVDRFKATLAPMMANGGIRSYAQFGMKMQTERDDQLLGGVYGASLLYLVRNACEKDEAPILGLEESISHDSQMQALWNGTTRTLILSPTGQQGPRNSSEATTHGGFDDDQPTMEAVARRVLDWPDSQPLPRPMNLHRARESRALRSADRDGVWVSPVSTMASSSRAVIPSRRGASVRALCIGIDDYVRAPLSACVADMEAWVRIMEARGVVVQRTLANHQATKRAIVQAWREVAGALRPGDTFVVQYAGHGTQVPDQGVGRPGGGDELYDSAWVPIDGEEGEVLVDDEIGALIDAVPSGVRVVLFTDCCHSGTTTRARGVVAKPGTRVRFLPLMHDGSFLEKYARKREAWSQLLSPQAGRVRNALGAEIHFAACQDHQLASERGGHGDFTRASMKVFDAQDMTRLTCQAFHDAVSAQFAQNADQQPNFRAQVADRDQLLWAAVGAPTAARPLTSMAAAGGPLDARLDHIDARLAELERLIRRAL